MSERDPLFAGVTISLATEFPEGYEVGTIVEFGGPTAYEVAWISEDRRRVRLGIPLRTSPSGDESSAEAADTEQARPAADAS